MGVWVRGGEKEGGQSERGVATEGGGAGKGEKEGINGKGWHGIRWATFKQARRPLLCNGVSMTPSSNTKKLDMPYFYRRTVGWRNNQIPRPLHKEPSVLSHVLHCARLQNRASSLVPAMSQHDYVCDRSSARFCNNSARIC